MNQDAFARNLGFADFETLLDASETVAHERGNDVQWYITKLPNGVWAAWDDAKLDIDRVEYANNEIGAVQFIYDGLIASGYDVTAEPVVEKYRVHAEPDDGLWVVNAYGHRFYASFLSRNEEDAIQEVLGGCGEHDPSCECA